MNSRLLLQSQDDAAPAPADVEAAPSASAGGDVPRSYYSPSYQINCVGGWVRKAAEEVHLVGALLLLRERLGFKLVREWRWVDLDASSWRRMDTWQRLNWLKGAIETEIAEAMNETLELVEIGPVSTLGD